MLSHLDSDQMGLWYLFLSFGNLAFHSRRGTGIFLHASYRLFVERRFEIAEEGILNGTRMRTLALTASSLPISSRR